MTRQDLGLEVLGTLGDLGILAVLTGVLLVCVGLLLGAAWTIQALQPRLRRQAEERRRLNEEWQAVHTARRQQLECPNCGARLADGA